jgi:hypothetical protein
MARTKNKGETVEGNGPGDGCSEPLPANLSPEAIFPHGLPPGWRLMTKEERSTALPVPSRRCVETELAIQQTLNQQIESAKNDVLSSDGREHDDHWLRLDGLYAQLEESWARLDGVAGAADRARKGRAARLASEASEWSSWPLPLDGRPTTKTNWYRRLCWHVERLLEVRTPAAPFSARARLLVAAVEKALRSAPPDAPALRDLKPPAKGGADYVKRLESARLEIERYLRDNFRGPGESPADTSGARQKKPKAEAIVRMVLIQYGYPRGKADELPKLLDRRTAKDRPARTPSSGAKG